MTIPNKFNPFGISRNKNKMPTDKLDFYAPFETNFNDVIHGLVGNLNNVNANIQIKTDDTSNIGNYLYCDTSSDIYSRYYIQYSGSESLFQYGTNDLTISFFIRISDWNPYINNQIIISNYVSSTGGYIGFVLYKDGNRRSKIDARLYGENNFFTSTNAQSSEWVHWCLVRKNGQLFWYRNGVLDATGTNTSDINSLNPLQIGDSSVWSNNYAKFDLKALRIYGKALSLQEIDLLKNEFDIKYKITALNQGFTFSPVSSSSVSIVYSSNGTVNNFEIISGSLPSNITFNTSTGTFTGIATTDADHTYDLVIKLSGPNVIPKNINFTVSTRATSILTAPSPQTFNFTTEIFSYTKLNVTRENENISYEVTSGEVPGNIWIYDQGIDDDNDIYIGFNGEQPYASTASFTLALTTPYHPSPIYVTCNININLNQISANDETINFYTSEGSASHQINYSSPQEITPVYSISGILPSGVTFNTSTGVFTFDGTSSAHESSVVQVEIGSSTGYSEPAIIDVTLNVVEGERSIPTDYVMYHSLTGHMTTPEVGGSFSIGGTSPISASIDNIDCAYFAGNGGLKQTGQSYWTQNNPVITLSIWGKCLDTNNAAALATGKWVTDGAYEIMKEYYWKCIGAGDNDIVATNVDITKWHHICSILDNINKTRTLYIDNEFIGSAVYYTDRNIENNVAIGGNFNSLRNIPRDDWFNGYLAAARIYNRALNQYEIKALSEEFKDNPKN